MGCPAYVHLVLGGPAALREDSRGFAASVREDCPCWKEKIEVQALEVGHHLERSPGVFLPEKWDSAGFSQ